MHQHEKINYVEFPSTDFDATKDFFNAVFGWEFTDYGENYTAFSDQGLDGGFFKSTKCSSTKNGSALVVFYSNALEETEKKIEASTGKITQEIFSFPGGRRFHFTDPTGNEFAVWSDK
jgi:predicted enzyme related to lactoylglutathione lyase